MSFHQTARAAIRRGAPALAAACLPIWLAAQQPGDSTRKARPARATPLAELVVTAARIVQRIGEVPASVTVLTRRDLSSSAAQTIPAELSRIPGYAARDYQNPLVASPSRSAPSFRGLGGSSAGRTLVLFDGVPLNEPFSGAVDWARVPLALVDRVEAVRGGGSMVWGSRALGGIINVLTRPQESTRANLELEGGDRSTFRGSGDLTVHGGPVSATLAGSLGRSAGFRTIRPDQAGPIDVATETSQKMALAKVSLNLTRSLRAYLGSNYLRSWHDGPTPADSGPVTVAEVRAGLRLSAPRGGVLDLSGYGNHRTSLIVASNVATDRTTETVRSYSRSPSDGFGISLQWSQASGPHSLTAGADGSVARGNAREDYGIAQGVATLQRISSGQQLLGGVFLQDGWALGRRWRLLGALRADLVRDEQGHRLERNLSSGAVLLDTAYAPRTASRVSFSAGVHQEVTRWLAWRVSAYQAFRAATLSEEYRPNKGTGRGNITESNPDLRPERLTGAELGADLTLAEGFLLRFGGFWNHVSDPIVDYTVGVAAANGAVIEPCGALLKDQVCRQRRNVAALRTVGLEAEIEYHPRAEWSFWGSYSFNPTRVSAPGQPIDGKAARGAAEHVLTSFVSWDQPRLFGVTLEGRYVSSRFDDDLNSLRLGDFAVLGVRVNRRFSRQSSVYLKVDNIFNRQFEVTRSTTGIIEIGGPRWVLAGIRATL